MSISKICEKLKEISEEELEYVERDIEKIINKYNSRNECLAILQGRVMSYLELVDFFNYLVKKHYLISEYLYLSNEGYGTNTIELIEYINKIEPIECRESFLMKLTSDCMENNINLYNDMMCIHDENGFLYFMNNEQITKEFIIPILSNRDFILDKDVGVELLKILKR